MKERLSNSQIVFVIFGIIFGYGIMSLPKDIAETSGTSGWISLIISAIISLVILNIIVTLNLKYENMTLDEYSTKIVGNVITKIILVIYIIYFFLIFSMITRVSCEVTKLSILLNTPLWALILPLLLVSCYAVYKKLKAISNISIVYGLIIIVFTILIHLLMLSEGELTNIQPLFYPLNIDVIIKSLAVSIFPFLGIEILLLVPLSLKGNKKIKLHSSLMLLFIGLFYILIVQSCISVMGVAGIIHYKDALISTMRRVDIEFLNAFRRLDGIFIISWIMSIYCTIIFFLYGIVFLISRLFSRFGYGYICIAVTVCAFIFSLLPQNIEQVEMILNYIEYLGLITAFIIPLLLLIISGVKTNAKKDM